jgi:putative ABC transport system substrate-binding protein
MYMGVQSTGEPGVLMGYGPNFGSMLRLLPYFIDRILKGAKPGDLPVQLVEDYQLGLNLDVARKLGITFPPSLLIRADVVVDGEKPAGGVPTPRKVPY